MSPQTLPIRVCPVAFLWRRRRPGFQESYCARTKMATRPIAPPSLIAQIPPSEERVRPPSRALARRSYSGAVAAIRPASAE